jgi:hypothetical protein
VRASSAGVAMTSSGIAGLDAAAGGGLAVGSLTLLVEDSRTTHYDALARLFLAQGLAHGHAVALAQQHAPASKSFATLPSPRGYAPPGGQTRPASGGGGGAGGADGLNIAWRYAQAKASGTVAGTTSIDSTAATYRHAFDLSDTCAPPESAPVSHLGLGRSDRLSVLLRDVRSHLNSATRRGLLARLAVCGLVPSLWDVDTGSLERFLHLLRVQVQRSGAVALVTVPKDALSPQLVRESDLVLRLDTFEGRGAGAAGLGGEWLGTLTVAKRFSPLGSVKAVSRQTDVWVFKRGRRKYAFEPAAAAPEVDDDAWEASKQPPKGAAATNSQGPLCAPGPQGNKFEF